MADPTTYNRMVLKLVSPFAKYDETEHIWSVKFSLSGAEITDESDAEATALDLWAPIAMLNQPATSLIGWLYYAPGSSVNKYQATYDAGVKPGTAAAYTGANYVQQLEVCGLARCPVGVNSKGRAKYLFKHIHDVSGDDTGGMFAPIESGETILHNWNAGCGPDELVPVDPTTGVQGGPWTLQEALYTRQLRRGQKKA